ncbi:MAG TPA: hypothetical protein VGG19_20655 [Tepidisphaeraceae bacterium]|jgi:hypothetical protein
MSLWKRLDDLEDAFAGRRGEMDEREAQNFLLRKFADADPGNKATVERCAEISGSRNALAMIKHSECGELRRAIGNYCRANRYRFPGAKLIHCHHGNNVVTMSGNGALLQVMADLPMPEMESAQ